MADTEFFEKAVEAARNFKDFEEVLMAVSLHPEWLTLLPTGRRWTILHQIIFSGDVSHLNQVLALQRSNKEFRLLTATRDEETVLDVANRRQDAPAMKARLEQLIKLDEMLNHARNKHWDQCYKIVEENPLLFNEKPPYRQCYLIHHLAYANAIEPFKKFKKIKGCTINSTLRLKRKKINAIAREAKCSEFANFIEKEYPSLLEDTDAAFDESSKPSEEAIQKTKAVTLMVQQGVVKDLDEDLLGEAQKPKSRAEVMQQLNAMPSTDRKKRHQPSASVSKAEEDKRHLLVLDSVTCPLTLAVFMDPVIAADGFTYERKAITKWLEKNNLSPMTNEPLANKDLNPNNVVKMIITALQPKS